MDNTNSNNKFTLNLTSEVKRNILYIIGAASVLILAYGFFKAINDVPFPKHELPVFPSERYKSASEVNTNGVEIMDSRFLVNILRTELRKNYPSINSFQYEIADELRGRRVIMKKIENLYSQVEIKNLIEDTENGLTRQSDSIRRSLRINGYEEFYQPRSLQIIERKLSNLIQLKNDLSNMSFSTVMRFPLHDKAEEFSIIYGTLERIDNMGGYKFQVIFKDAYPLLSKTLAQNKGFGAEELNSINFQEDNGKFELIVKSARQAFKQDYKLKKKMLRDTTRMRRNSIRVDFYAKWFAILLHIIVSSFVLFVLFQYSKIIRREGLPQKDTHEVYFATNMTSLFLRWVALTIVILGMLLIFFEFIFLLFAGRIFEVYPLFKTLSFLYSLISPFVHLIGIVLLSWVFLLKSEFICFISNCYHIIFRKTFDPPPSIKEDKI